MVAKETNFLKIICTGIDKYENEYENENENMKTKKFSSLWNHVKSLSTAKFIYTKFILTPPRFSSFWIWILKIAYLLK